MIILTCLDLDKVTLHAWGPYRSSIYHLYQQLVIKEPEENHFVLMACGSGFGYLMDAMGILAFKHLPKSEKHIPTVDIHFSIRCRTFLEYMRPDIEHLMKLIKDKNSANVSFTVYVTENEKDFATNVEKLQSSDSGNKIGVKKG